MAFFLSQIDKNPLICGEIFKFQENICKDLSRGNFLLNNENFFLMLGPKNVQQFFDLVTVHLDELQL